MSKTASYTHNHDIDYHSLLDTVVSYFDTQMMGVSVLFSTHADPEVMWNTYLEGVDADRQVHNCSACRQFIQRYGNLVKVTDYGNLESVIWPKDLDGFYGLAFKLLAEEAEQHKIENVFLSSLPTWGTPQTGEWKHFAVNPPRKLLHMSKTINAGQAMAAMLERKRIVAEALRDFSAEALDQGLRVLKADAVNRSEKFVAPVQWLRDLHDLPKRGRERDNLMWVKIATAPEGYCHPRSAVTGTMLEDIKEGLDFEAIRKRFNEKVHPLAYQRPQAAPTVGNIKRAEELVEKLGIGPSLERRFATIEDLKPWWKPIAEEKLKSDGVFGHIKPKNGEQVAPITLPRRTMTWEKFKSTILAPCIITEIEMVVPQSGSFIATTSAVHKDAPPILKWDYEDARNPVAWYVYPGGSPPSRWGLRAGTWAKVTAITDFPTMWGDRPQAHIGSGCILVLEGCVDSNVNAGNALFPECLKNELHEVRATIEAYSRKAALEGRTEASGCGYALSKGNVGILLRAKIKGQWEAFDIDRME